MRTLYADFFQASRDGPENSRSLLYFAYVSLCTLFLLTLFGHWQFSERRDSLIAKRNLQSESYLVRSNTLLELDKLLQRGAVLSNITPDDLTGFAMGQGQASAQQVLFRTRLRDAQRLLARPELRGWQAAEVPEVIDRLYRMLELYMTVDPVVVSEAIAPIADSQLMLSLLQELHRAHVENAALIDLDSRNIQALERYFYLVNIFLLVLVLAPLGLVVWYAGRTHALLLRKRVYIKRVTLAFNAMPETALVLDANGRIIVANRAIMTLLGYTPSAIQGQLFSALLPAHFLPQFASFCSAVINGSDRGGLAREFLLICRSGSEIPAEVKAQPMVVGGKTYLALTVRDLREQHYLQDQLRISQRRFELAVAATRDGMWDWDLTKGRVFFSQTWRNMLGIPARTLSNDDQAVLALVIPQEDLAGFKRKIRSYVRSDGMQFRFEHRLQHRDGRILNVICRASAERDSKGRIVRVVGTHSDITEIKRREQETFAVNRRLENLLQRQADRQESAVPSGSPQFLSVLGHEIRTPMNGLLGMTDMLVKTPLNPEQRMMADTIRESSANLLSVLDDLLDFGALHDNSLMLDWQRVDLMALIDGILAGFCRHSGRTVGQHIYFYPAANLPAVVVADPQRITQIFSKLIDNALKFSQSSKPRGVVKIWLDAEQIENGGSGLNLHFRVRDNGIGIPQEVRGNLFKPFAQGDSGRGRRYGGSGLGLAICGRLVKLLDGTIDIQSEVGQFTEVSVGLPVQAIPSPSMASQRRVLLQIQNESLRGSVAAILTHAGFEVVDCIADNRHPEAGDAELLVVADTVDQDRSGPRLVLLPRPRGEQRGALGNQVFINPLLPSALLGGLASLETQLEEGR